MKPHKTIEEIKRPEILPCDVYQIKKENVKWLIFAGIHEKNLFEIFVSHDNNDPTEDVLYIPKTITSGIIKKISWISNNEKCNQFNFIYQDKHGFNITMEAINRVTDPRFHNININVSFMLRYLPNEIIIKIIKRWKDLDPLTQELREVLIEIISKYIKNDIN
ncbi:MAG: hypothetical protein WCT85_03875 [Parachlamydiales bacterium]|jgi:hypothetical protein